MDEHPACHACIAPDGVGTVMLFDALDWTGHAIRMRPGSSTRGSRTGASAAFISLHGRPVEIPCDTAHLTSPKTGASIGANGENR